LGHLGLLVISNATDLRYISLQGLPDGLLLFPEQTGILLNLGYKFNPITRKGIIPEKAVRRTNLNLRRDLACNCNFYILFPFPILSFIKQEEHVCFVHLFFPVFYSKVRLLAVTAESMFYTLPPESGIFVATAIFTLLSLQQSSGMQQDRFSGNLGENIGHCAFCKIHNYLDVLVNQASGIGMPKTGLSVLCRRGSTAGDA
jgi:hypothetical protein